MITLLYLHIRAWDMQWAQKFGFRIAYHDLFGLTTTQEERTEEGYR